MNGSWKTHAHRYEGLGWAEHDTVTATTQFKLQKGDTVHVYFSGYFFEPNHGYNAYFEGHLISQINE